MTPRNSRRNRSEVVENLLPAVALLNTRRGSRFFNIFDKNNAEVEPGEISPDQAMTQENDLFNGTNPVSALIKAHFVCVRVF